MSLGPRSRRDARVLWGVAFESQQGAPFAPLPAAMLERASPIRQVQSIREVGGDADLHYWILHDLKGALESVADEAPLVILLDDLQWADTRTVRVLSTLPSRLAGSPVLWILAMRSREPRRLTREAMARLERDGATYG